MAEPGKRWENNFKKSIPDAVRLYDTTNGYAGVKNPCDFIYYVYPYQYMIELKSVASNRFDFNLITDNQREELNYYDSIYGVTSLVCVEFREAKVCVAIPYKLIELLNKQGKKSINYMKAQTMLEKFIIPTKYARTNCQILELPFKYVLKQISEMGGVYEITD